MRCSCSTAVLGRRPAKQRLGARHGGGCLQRRPWHACPRRHGCVHAASCIHGGAKPTLAGPCRPGPTHAGGGCQHAQRAGAGACRGVHPPGRQASQLCDGPGRRARPRLGCAVPPPGQGQGQPPRAGPRPWRARVEQRCSAGSQFGVRTRGRRTSGPKSGAGWGVRRGRLAPVLPPLQPK